jgi:3-methyladenine DNA glycosylase AlkD
MTNASKTKLIKDIRETFLNMIDPKRIEIAPTLYPSKAEILGVRVPDIRKVMKEVRLQTKDYSSSEKLALAKALVRTDIFEFAHLAFLYLEKEKSALKILNPEDIEDLNRNIDNWVMTDTYAPIVVGYAWREGIIGTDYIKQLYTSHDVWMRRVAIVATIALNQKAKGGEGDAGRTIELCRMAVEDHEDMIVKALSWALRVLSQRDREAVSDFIEQYESRLHKRVLREVRHKLETGLKN